jgi:Ala-tRNA(Pro) deacylase
VKPGAVTILALVNDSAGHVAAFIDRGLVEGELMQCHPMENTSTLVVSPSEVLRYLSEKGRTVKILDVPAMEG